jgi:pimeloyl-ACP methyl ester carboxylesterase
MTNTTNTPTIVLVHGGFADASFWAPVIRELQASDLPVLAPANPLRGLALDAEYIASFVRQIDGPVLLVGHSYGGAVISVAGAAADNVVAWSTSRRSRSTRASPSRRSSSASGRPRSSGRCGRVSTRWPAAARPRS